MKCPLGRHDHPQSAVTPLQTPVDALRETVNAFQSRLTSAGSLAGENFDRLTVAESALKFLQSQNTSLLDRLDDLGIAVVSGFWLRLLLPDR